MESKMETTLWGLGLRGLGFRGWGPGSKICLWKGSMLSGLYPPVVPLNS